MSDRPKSSAGTRKIQPNEPDPDVELVEAVDRCSSVARKVASRIDKMAEDLQRMLAANPSPFLVKR